MEKWRDAAAVNVIVHTKRVLLLDKLEIDRDFMSYFNEVLTSHEMDYIRTRSTRLQRAKSFIDTLAMKLTTEVFYDLLCALPNALRKEVYQAYRIGKNDF